MNTNLCTLSGDGFPIKPFRRNYLPALLPDTSQFLNLLLNYQAGSILKRPPRVCPVQYQSIIFYRNDYMVSLQHCFNNNFPHLPQV